jgi:hypothetical protein
MGFDPVAVGDYRVVDNYAVGPCRSEQAFHGVDRPAFDPAAGYLAADCYHAEYFPDEMFRGPRRAPAAV